MKNNRTFLEKLLDGAEVKWIPLGDVADYEQPTKYLVNSTVYNDNYPIPVLTAGKTFILGYTNEDEGIYFASKSPVIIFDDFTTANKWVDFDFKAKSSAMKMITSKNEKFALLKYIYYWLNTLPNNQIDGDHKRQWISNYANKLIPIPPLSVQTEIVRILDALTALTSELTSELTLRRKQYEYYLDNLLSKEELGKIGFEWKCLKDICDYVDFRGKTPKKTESGIFLVTAKNIKKGFIDYNASKEFVSESDYIEIMRRGLPRIGDVLITTEAPCGNVAQIDKEDIALAQRVIKYRSSNENILDNTFLKFMLLSKEFQVNLIKLSTGGTVKGIKGSTLHKMKIKIPPIDEQKRIVSILEKFEILTNSITEGLPLAIEQSQKRYEYYRELLLSFNGSNQ